MAGLSGYSTAFLSNSYTVSALDSIFFPIIQANASPRIKVNIELNQIEFYNTQNVLLGTVDATGFSLNVPQMLTLWDLIPNLSLDPAKINGPIVNVDLPQEWDALASSTLSSAPLINLPISKLLNTDQLQQNMLYFLYCDTSDNTVKLQQQSGLIYNRSQLFDSNLPSATSLLVPYKDQLGQVDGTFVTSEFSAFWSAQQSGFADTSKLGSLPVNKLVESAFALFSPNSTQLLKVNLLTGGVEYVASSALSIAQTQLTSLAPTNSILMGNGANGVTNMSLSALWNLQALSSIDWTKTTLNVQNALPLSTINHTTANDLQVLQVNNNGVVSWATLTDAHTAPSFTANSVPLTSLDGTGAIANQVLVYNGSTAFWTMLNSANITQQSLPLSVFDSSSVTEFNLIAQIGGTLSYTSFSNVWNGQPVNSLDWTRTTLNTAGALPLAALNKVGATDLQVLQVNNNGVISWATLTDAHTAPSFTQYSVPLTSISNTNAANNYVLQYTGSSAFWGPLSQSNYVAGSILLTAISTQSAPDYKFPMIVGGVLAYYNLLQMWSNQPANVLNSTPISEFPLSKIQNTVFATLAPNVNHYLYVDSLDNTIKADVVSNLGPMIGNVPLSQIFNADFASIPNNEKVMLFLDNTSGYFQETTQIPYFAIEGSNTAAAGSVLEGKPDGSVAVTLLTDVWSQLASATVDPSKLMNIPIGQLYEPNAPQVPFNNLLHVDTGSGQVTYLPANLLDINVNQLRDAGIASLTSLIIPFEDPVTFLPDGTFVSGEFSTLWSRQAFSSIDWTKTSLYVAQALPLDIIKHVDANNYNAVQYDVLQYNGSTTVWGPLAANNFPTGSIALTSIDGSGGADYQILGTLTTTVQYLDLSSIWNAQTISSIDWTKTTLNMAQALPLTTIDRSGSADNYVLQVNGSVISWAALSTAHTATSFAEGSVPTNALSSYDSVDANNLPALSKILSTNGTGGSDWTTFLQMWENQGAASLSLVPLVSLGFPTAPATNYNMIYSFGSAWTQDTFANFLSNGGLGLNDIPTNLPSTQNDIGYGTGLSLQLIQDNSTVTSVYSITKFATNLTDSLTGLAIFNNGQAPADTNLHSELWVSSSSPGEFIVTSRNNVGGNICSFMTNETPQANISNVGLFTSVSDMRMKENIRRKQVGMADGKNYLQRLLQLGVYSYNYKSDVTKGICVGYIAQEVEELFHGNCMGKRKRVGQTQQQQQENKDAEEIKSIAYSEISCYQTLAIQELAMGMMQLQEQNNILRKQNLMIMEQMEDMRICFGDAMKNRRKKQHQK